MFNSDVRKLKSEVGVEWALVADHMKISEGTLFRWLRHPMEIQRKQQVKEAILAVGELSTEDL